VKVGSRLAPLYVCHISLIPSELSQYVTFDITITIIALRVVYVAAGSVYLPRFHHFAVIYKTVNMSWEYQRAHVRSHMHTLYARHAVINKRTRNMRMATIRANVEFKPH